jgi:hypothetical protein
VHPTVHLEQRYRLTVDRYLYLLWSIGRVQSRPAIAYSSSSRFVMKRHTEYVLPIRWKMVLDCRSTPGPERRTINPIKL